MNGVTRREELLNLIKNSSEPLSGSALAKKLSVSRQVIVQDVALLKAAGNDIISTNRGYVLNTASRAERVFKMYHTDDEIPDELNTIVDLGGTVEDVFVWHRIFGKITAKMDINSRRNVAEYIESLKNGRSSPLKRVTSDYHYHTVSADTERTLNKIEAALAEKGFLVEEDEY